MATPAELRVRGSASREVEPDYAVIHVALEARHEQRAAAVAAAQDLLAEFRSATVDHDDIRASRISGIRVVEDYRWDAATSSQVAVGWLASLSGQVEAQSADVPAVTGRLAGTGAQLGYLDWRLDQDNPAFREVRAEAVADAVRAAEDFAAAVGRPLGELQVLADPGLLAANDAARPMMARAMAAEAGGAGPIDLDPAPQTVQASVEATFGLG